MTREASASIRVLPRPIPPGDLDLLAVGEAVVDLISVEEADSLRDARAFRVYAGGSPANIARTVARLGGRAALVARVGDDPFGHFLRAELEGAGVLCDGLVLDPAAQTTVIFVSQTRKTPDFLAYRDADFRLTPEQVTEEAVGRARMIHVSAFALSRPPARYATERALRLGQERGCILSVDPNYSPRLWPDQEEAMRILEGALALATLTKPSLDDARRLFGPGLSPEGYIRKFHELGPSVVVLTMGPEGVLVSEGEHIQPIPALPVPVADATGAGDAFWGGFLVALLDGLPLPDCARFAQHVAARKLAAVGPLTERIDRQALYAELGL
ncbi:MAG: sugar kinase [Thermoflexales bacterium]|nr:sugar kinase [Thermoflexales bacterium]